MEIAIFLALVLIICFGILLSLYIFYKIFLYLNHTLKPLLSTPNAIVVLNGKKKAGKTTMIELFKHGAFVPSYHPTKQPYIKKAATMITQNSRKYSFWDISGLYHSQDLQNLHNSLHEIHQKNIDIINIYVFNIAEYEEHKHELAMHAQNCKERGYIALAIATRGDKLNSTERRNLNAEMSRIYGMPTKVFDLTLAPVGEILNFIESGATNAARCKKHESHKLNHD